MKHKVVFVKKILNILIQKQDIEINFLTKNLIVFDAKLRFAVYDMLIHFERDSY